MSRLLCKHGRPNKKAIQEYIKNQLQDDIAGDQISLKEYVDPFTGEQAKKNKLKPLVRGSLGLICGC